MIETTEIFLKSVVDRAVKHMLCKSLDILEENFNPSDIEYYPVWKREFSSEGITKSLSRLKIRKNHERNFSNIPIESFEDDGLFWDDVIEYLQENKSTKITPKEFRSEKRLIYS